MSAEGQRAVLCKGCDRPNCAKRERPIYTRGPQRRAKALPLEFGPPVAGCLDGAALLMFTAGTMLYREVMGASAVQKEVER